MTSASLKKFIFAALLTGIFSASTQPISYCSEITYEDKSRAAFLAGDATLARDLALRALGSYQNPKSRKTTEARERLADAYEALGQKEEFLKELKWLRKKARTEKKRKLIDARKKRFLKNHYTKRY